MTMPWADALRYLRCPRCETPLTRHQTAAGTELWCTNDDGHVFRMNGEVPVFATDPYTSKTYDFKWRMMPEYGYDDVTKTFRMNWYVKRYGWMSEEGLSDFLRGCGAVLDVGTGLGSHALMYARMTKGSVFGMDISDSVCHAQHRFGKTHNATLVRADLHDAPFEHQAFDLVVADQVLHHTPDTESALRALVPLVKRGGQLAFYVYRKKSPAREYCDDLLREYTTRMPPGKCLKFGKIMAKLGRDLSRLDEELQMNLYQNVVKCFWSANLGFETSALVNFDWYHPRFAWRHTAEEVEGWVKDAGLKIVHMDREDPSGISVRARKDSL